MAAAIGIADNIRPKIQGTLDSLSISDFAHDFGSTYIYSLLNNVSLSTKLSNAQRAAIVAKIIVDIANKVKEENKNNKSRAKSATWNLYDHFHNDLRATVFPEGIKKETRYNEIGSVDSVLNGTTLQQIKNHFFPTIGKGIAALPTIRDIKIKSHEPGQVNRSYTVNAVKFKYGNAPQYNRTLSEVFRELTGVNKVGIMEDASTIPMSELSTVERFDDAQTANFTYYIIKSIENESDSANKVNAYWDDTDKVRKIFLKDADSGNTYPSFSGGVGNNAAVYTHLKFNTWRNKNGEIDGTYHLPDDEKVEIYNLSESSKIAKTALKVMETYIDNYNDYAAKSKAAILKTCLYFPVKKFGDWCQALCLLDTSRKYTQTNQNGINIPGEITLSEIANRGTVGVLTGDQILLAYSLLIGVNVFFTVKVRPLSDAVEPVTTKTDTNTLKKAKGKKDTKAAKRATDGAAKVAADDEEHSDHWLFYFRNNSSDEALVDNNVELIEILELLNTRLDTNLAEMTPIVTASKIASERIGANGKLIVRGGREVKNEIKEYIDDLRKKGRIHSSSPLENIAAIKREIQNMLTKLNIPGPHKKREFRVDFLETRVGELIKQNETLLEGLSEDELQTTSDVIDLMFSDTILSDTTKFQRFLSTVLYPIRDDFKGTDNRISRIVSFVEEDNLLLAGRLVGRASRVKISNHKKFVNTLNDVFSKFLPVAGGTQFARTWEQQKADLMNAFNKIRLRSILVFDPTTRRERGEEDEGPDEPLPDEGAGVGPIIRLESAFNAVSEAAEPVEPVELDEPAPDSQYYIMPIGGYVIDRNGNYCSVLDKYIVTLDECDTFISAKNDACAVIKTSILQKLDENEEESQKAFRTKVAEPDNKKYYIITNYLYYRFVLLRHDILYTRYKVLEIEPTDAEINILINDTLTLINNIEKEEGAKIPNKAFEPRASERKSASAIKKANNAEEILKRLQRERLTTKEADTARSEAAANLAKTTDAAEMASKQFTIAKLNYIKGLLNGIRSFIFNGYTKSLKSEISYYESNEPIFRGQKALDEDLGLVKFSQFTYIKIAQYDREDIVNEQNRMIKAEETAEAAAAAKAALEAASKGQGSFFERCSVMGGYKTRRSGKKSKNRYTRHLRHLRHLRHA